MAAKTVKRDYKQEELDRLLENRRYRFRKALGDDWANDDIEALTKRNDIYPNDLEKLLEQGCPKRTAVRILI